MLFADAEGFWKPPNVYDVIGIVGFVVGIGSVWLSWRLAKQDIKKRLDEAADRASKAARDEVRRVANAVIHSGVADTVRSLELAREACRAKQWPRGGELCELAREQLAWALSQPAVSADTMNELQDVTLTLLDCVAWLRRQPKRGSGEMPDEVRRGLDDSILALHRAEGRMTGIRVEADRG